MRKIALGIAFLIALTGSAFAQAIPNLIGPGPVPPQVLLSLNNAWSGTNAFGGCTIVTDGLCVAGTTSLGNVNFTNATVPAVGLYLQSANQIGLATNTTGRIIFGSSSFSSLTAGSFRFNYTAASATNPTLLPFGTATTTGIGADASGDISEIIAGTEIGRWSASGLKFLGTIPTATGTGSPTVTTGSTDNAGSVTAGTTATSVVITSGNTGYTTAPFCIVQPVTQLVAFSAPVTVSAGRFVITVTQTATSGDLITWHCYKNT